MTPQQPRQPAHGPRNQRKTDSMTTPTDQTQTSNVPSGAVTGSAFRCIVADPPWELSRAGGWNTTKNHRPLEYATMDIQQIKALPIQALAEPVSWLFLWTVNAHVESAYSVARAWGFRPVTLLTWCKTPRGVGPGGMFSTTTEFLLYCRRGSASKEVGRKKAEPSSWFDWPRTPKHSM
jgi:N6-adenosine-specific RNA methylase IME4